MKKFQLLSIILLIALMISAACTSQPEPLEEPAEQPTSTNEESNSAEPTAPNSENVPTSEAEPTEITMPDLEGREITVAVTHDYLPFNYVLLESGQTGGWDYELLAQICDLINCQPKFVVSEWETMIQDVSDDKYDMAAEGITITKERKEIVDFSDGYLAIKQRMLVNADEDRFSDFAGFLTDTSLIVGALSDSTNFDAAVNLVGESRTRGLETLPELVEGLTNGEIDVVLLDDVGKSGYTGFQADQVTFIGESLTTEELGFVFPKRSELVRPFNLALEQLAADGTLDALTLKYFTDEFTLTYDDIAAPVLDE
ncbi:MAG: substrate-binding periplasmic protein [Anaerolineae bacterium]